MIFVFCATIVTWLILLALIPQLRRRLLDKPNSRSSHCQATPRGGGIVFVFLSLVASGIAIVSDNLLAAALVPLPLLAAPLSVVSLLDDRHNLPASLRYCFHLFTAVLILCFSPLFQQLVLVLPVGSCLFLLILAFLTVAVTAVVNFTNFMDGLDGLVAGCMVVAIATLSFVLDAPFPFWVLVGSLLGFLLWNWSPAKVFMGDVGSTFWVPFLLAWCSRPPAGQRRLAVSL